jgi:hypothetical protein
MIVNQIQAKQKLSPDHYYVDINENGGEDNLQQNLQFLVIFHQVVSSFKVCFIQYGYNYH